LLPKMETGRSLAGLKGTLLAFGNRQGEKRSHGVTHRRRQEKKSELILGKNEKEKR